MQHAGDIVGLAGRENDVPVDAAVRGGEGGGDLGAVVQTVAERIQGAGAPAKYGWRDGVRRPVGEAPLWCCEDGQDEESESDEGERGSHDSVSLAVEVTVVDVT